MPLLPAPPQPRPPGLARESEAPKVIDKAFLTSQAAPAPKGLTSLKDATAVDLELENLDCFSVAQYTAEAKGAIITAFLPSP